MLPQFRTFGLAREVLGFQGVSGGLAALPTALTINSTTVEPTYWYQGKDASTSSWTTTVGSGGTLTGAGSGGTAGLDSPTPNSADRAVDPSTTRRWDGAASVTLDSDDLVFEAVGQLSAVTNGHIAGTRSATQGFNLRRNSTSSGFDIFIADATTSASIKTATTLTTGAWFHLMGFIDRSGSGQAYLFGAASGSPVVVSAVGAITDDDSLTIGALPGGAGGLEHDALIAHFAMWKQSAWLDTHLQAAVARERYARAFGLYATGATLQSNSRASAAYVDRVSHVDGIRRLHYLGAGAHRMGRAYDKHLRVGAGYLSESAATNLCLQSQTLNTTWAKIDAGDTVDETNAEAPDGTTTMNLITGDATDGEHGVSQSITLTAAAHTMACYFEAGTAGWAYMDVSTIANVSAYFDLGSGIVGTVGSAATADIEYLGNNKYRAQLRYTGTAAAHTHRIVMAEADGDKSTASKTLKAWGAMVHLGSAPVSYIPSTTTTVTRVADDLEYDGSGLDFTRGTFAADVLINDAGANQHVAEIGDGTNDDKLVFLAHAADNYRLSVKAGGVNTALISDSTTNVKDGAWREVRATWRTDDMHVYVDGTEEGTPDTSAAVSAVMDTVYMGKKNAAGEYLDGLVLPRIYSKPTTKRVTNFGEIMAYSAAYISSAGGIALNATTYTALAETWTEIATSDFTVSAAGVHTYTGTATKRFAVSIGISSSASAAMDPLLVAVMKNGTETSSSKAARKVPITDVGRMAVVDHVQLANGDTITPGALADSGTPTLTCDYCTVLLSEVS